MKTSFGYLEILFISILFIASFNSCNEQEEACLDPLAINFRASATVSCCCTYATMRIQWFPKLLDSTFADSIPIADAAGQSFYLRELDILFSEVNLYPENDEGIGVLDLITITDLSDTSSHRLVDDVFRFTLGSQFSTMGSVRMKGKAERLSFRTGISPVWNRSNPLEFSATHPLVRSPSMFLATDIGYAMLRLRISFNPEDNTGLEILIPVYSFSILNIPLDYDVPRNSNFDIPLVLDLTALFDGVFIQGMSLTNLGAKLTENLPGAVYQHIP